MTSILILQNEIKSYRKPVYNGLAEEYDVVVLHSGSPSVSPIDRYREVITPQKQFWRLTFQPYSPLGKIINEFDVVIAMFDISWPGYLLPLFWRKRVKYVLWGHWYSTNYIVNFIRNFLMRQSDRILMYGAEEVDRMILSGIDKNKITVAPNTVLVTNSRDCSLNKKSRFLFIGRLHSGSRRNSKRVDILVEAFSRIQGLIPNQIVLDIVGEGEEEDSLKLLASRLNIADKICFHGYIDDESSLSKLFLESFALVSPGHVGLSVLQSFAYGVPVITGNAVQYRRETQHLYNVMTGNSVIMGPEYYNLRHEENALLVDTRQQLEDALINLCNQPDYAAELGHNAYKHYFEERPLSRMLDGFRKVIEK